MMHEIGGTKIKRSQVNFYCNIGNDSGASA